jgi:acyl carrier protein
VALLMPDGVAADPDWIAGLEARGVRVVALRPEQAKREALDDLLAEIRRPAAAPAPREETAAGHDRPGIATPYQEPATATERRLARIWGALLGIDRVGVHDDFFELGGHSLLATRLVSRIREELGGEIALETVFAEPTIARLAARLGSGEKEQAPRIPRASRAEDLPLSTAQQQIWVLQQLDRTSPAYNLPGAFRLRGALDAAAVAWALGQVAARHEILRTTFPAVQGWPVQRIAPGAEAPLPMIDLGSLEEAPAGQEVRELLVQDVLRPFDLARGPAFRAALFRLADDDHVLWLSFHHICFDGWSWGVLFSELAALYESHRMGRPAPLPPLPLQYADFAAWQRGRAALAEAQLAWWRERLAGKVPLQLAPERLPGGGRPAGALETFELAPELTESLSALGQAEGSTLFVVLLALFNVLLHQRTGREDISVGSPVAGRLSSEVEGLIGNFVNTVVLRTALAGAPSFRELLARVRETALEAHSRQEVPYEQVAAALHDRTNRRARLFEVWFVLHNTPAPALALPGLAIAPLPMSGKAPRHDLSFSLWPEARGLSAALEYRTDLFPQPVVRQIAEDFTTLAEAVVADSGLRLPALAGLLGRSQQERQEARKQAAKGAGLERLRAKRREAV